MIFTFQTYSSGLFVHSSSGPVNLNEIWLKCNNLLSLWNKFSFHLMIWIPLRFSSRALYSSGSIVVFNTHIFQSFPNSRRIKIKSRPTFYFAFVEYPVPLGCLSKYRNKMWSQHNIPLTGHLHTFKATDFLTSQYRKSVYIFIVSLYIN